MGKNAHGGFATGAHESCGIMSSVHGEQAQARMNMRDPWQELLRGRQTTCDRDNVSDLVIFTGLYDHPLTGIPGFTEPFIRSLPSAVSCYWIVMTSGGFSRDSSGI